MVIQIDIVPHADNRLLKVSAVSDRYCWRGEQALAGVDSPQRIVFEVRELPAGHYDVCGEILGPAGQLRGMVARRVTLKPRAVSGTV